jgi:hypothetical protein
MQVTVSIHEAWFARPEDLRRVLALLAGLEVPPPGAAARPVAIAEEYDPREDLEEPFDPERRAPARREPDRGDAWKPPFDEFQEPPRGYPGLTPSPRTSAGPEEQDPEEESPPTDGRQLLGWAAKQVPDAKGAVMSFGKRNGYPSKIVSWTAEQVRAAYQHARGTQQSMGG